MALLALPLLAAAAAAHLVLMFREGRWLEHPMTAGRMLFTLFSVAVYAAAAARVALKRSRGAAIAAVGVIGVAAWAIGDALFVHRGDQRGLVFVFLPPLQWIIFAILTALF